MRAHVVRNLQLLTLGALSGVLAGVASFVFLELLDAVTDTRLDHEWLVWLLPLAGLFVGFVYHRVGGRAGGGTALAVSEAHAYTIGAPARMAPLVLGGTLLGHLFGASVGREGTAVQMSASLTDAGARRLHLDHDQRATLARAALAGGFGAVFGVPFAGVVFALEVARRRTWRALVAAVPAAFVGHGVVRLLGHDHHPRPNIVVPFDAGNVLGLVAAGVAFGLTALAFARVVPLTKRWMQHLVPWAPLRPAIGGGATAVLALVLGADYLGLSLPLLDDAFLGDAGWHDPALKLLFTVIALGSGFVGGEVTPLFVIGGTLGSVLAEPLGLAPVALAAVGLVAVFGAAAHVPLASAVMAGELFGPHTMVPALVVCLIARVLVIGDGIYVDGGERHAGGPAHAAPAAVT